MSFSCLKKQIVYRGGVVRFWIPAHWKEEYEEDGGGTFYEPGDDTGTLRLNVLSFLKTGVMAEDLSCIVRKRETKESGRMEVLPGGRILLKYSHRHHENDDDLTIFYWEVAKMVSPRDYNIAVFSFTVTSKQLTTNPMLPEISSIDCEIREVSFADQKGEMNSTSQP